MYWIAYNFLKMSVFGFVSVSVSVVFFSHNAGTRGGSPKPPLPKFSKHFKENYAKTFFV
jgi:hypothetical protein